MFDSRSKKDLQANANSKNWSPAGKSAIDGAASIDVLDTSHASGVGANTWNDQSIALHSQSRVRSDLNRGADTFECTLGRSQVAASVIENNDARATKGGHGNRWVGGKRSGRGERPLGRGNTNNAWIDDDSIAQ
jgi:hypothetical protein